MDDHWNEIIAELLKYRADLVQNGKIIYVRFARTTTGKNHAQYAQERATRELGFAVTASPAAGGLFFSKKSK